MDRETATVEVKKLLDTNLSTPRIYELLRTLPREGADTPQNRALLKKIFDEPTVYQLVDTIVNVFRANIDEISKSAATIAFNAAVRLNQPEVKQKLLGGAKKVEGGLESAEKGLTRYVEVVFPIAQRVMSGVIWTIDVILRFSVPVLSRIIGYSLKVLGPLVIAAIPGIVAATPLAALSDPKCKIIADLDEEVSRMIIDRTLRSKVKLFQYVKGAGPPGTFIGAMADVLPAFVSDGHQISVISYLGALTLIAQRQQSQLDDIETTLRALRATMADDSQFS